LAVTHAATTCGASVAPRATLEIAAASLARTTISAALPPTRAALIPRSSGRGATALSTGSSRTPKTPPIASIRATRPTFASIVVTSTLTTASTFWRGRFFLSPLRAKAEALQLGQVEFVEIRRRIFLGSVVVHNFR
jgi:hypothetical protein